MTFVLYSPEVRIRSRTKSDVNIYNVLYLLRSWGFIIKTAIKSTAPFFMTIHIFDVCKEKQPKNPFICCADSINQHCLSTWIILLIQCMHVLMNNNIKMKMTLHLSLSFALSLFCLMFHSFGTEMCASIQFQMARVSMRNKLLTLFAGGFLCYLLAE